ncbi:PadR family transcriptional regulator [Metasolibacillus meyeri]|uniref:PadR family transcriptional regulator n=1 Tax=Metasolibacillus meyeri TaxID=1071052 RepID=UPI000D2FE326|nr:PadR family transcriptional regulator [Metasolibacillus meyeri]
MSLKHTILGFLNMNAFTGYNLWQMFNGSVKNYWSATHTQIYRTLSELEKGNMVEVELVQQEKHPNKKVYHLTESGKKELLKWLQTPIDLPPVRDKFLVQFSFSDILAHEDIIHNIESYIEKIEMKLEDLKSDQYKVYFQYAHSHRERFLWEKTIEHGIWSYESELKWLKDCLKSYNELFVNEKSATRKGEGKKNERET